MTTPLRQTVDPQPGVAEINFHAPVIRVCGTVVIGVGIAVLVGWGLGLPNLASLGTGTIPVAPSTAALFILYATALLLRLRPPASGVPRIGCGLIACGGSISLLLLLCAVSGVHPDLEHAGITIIDTPGQAPIGHMSMVTATCFLVTALSYLAGLPTPRTAPWRATLAFSLAGVVSAANFLLLLAYLYGTPLFYGGGFIPPAALTCVAFLALGIALLVLAAPQARIPWLHLEPTARAAALFIIAFALLATGIVYAGFLSFKNYEKRFRVEVEAQLSAIAQLKVSELAHWREERLMDATILSRNSDLAALVRRYLADPGDLEAAQRLQGWLDAYHASTPSSPYAEVFLLDREGRARLRATGTAAPTSPPGPRQLAEALASGRVVFQDFTRDDQEQRISLALLVPIRETTDHTGLGLLVLGIDPATYLYPLIDRWPAASRTAQTLLARRHGDQLQILNGHQFGQEPPLSFHLPPGQPPMPSGQALLGRQGVVEGRDYRGVEVIADLRPVPASPWFMVSLIDKAEVYAPLRERLWLMIAFVGAMLLGTAACVGYLWRQQRLHAYQQQLLAATVLRQKSAELERRNAEMERFTYTVSHDLKSPLVTIKTFLGYLEQDMAQADQGRIGQDLGYIRGAVDKMRQLLDELLEMSRVGRVVNPPVTTTYREVVDEALRVVAGAISSRGVQVAVAPATVSLHGDRPRLVEVWQNLIENGVKYMGEQPQPRIEIGVRTEAGTTAFYVRDNGMGIDPRHQRKVFGLFDKLNPQSEGSGLGLALVKRIVELYDGKIWLESEGNGQGSCFWFTLPQAVQHKQGVYP